MIYLNYYIFFYLYANNNDSNEQQNDNISCLLSICVGRDIFKPPVLIRAGGGIYNYLYQLKPSSEESSQVKVDGSNILGKFQITWRTNLGEPGRLQTQNIHGTVSTQRSYLLTLIFNFDLCICFNHSTALKQFFSGNNSSLQYWQELMVPKAYSML